MAKEPGFACYSYSFLWVGFWASLGPEVGGLSLCKEAVSTDYTLNPSGWGPTFQAYCNEWVIWKIPSSPSNGPWDTPWALVRSCFHYLSGLLWLTWSPRLGEEMFTSVGVACWTGESPQRSPSPPSSTGSHPTLRPPNILILCPGIKWGRQGPCSECWAHFLVSYLMSILPSYHRYPPGRIPNEYKIGSLMPHPSKSELETHTLQRWTLETSITFLGTGYRLLGKH